MMEAATEGGMTGLQIAGVVIAILGIVAGGVWFRWWLTQRELDRRGPGNSKDEPKLPR
jgi:hypothetical protein